MQLVIVDDSPTRAPKELFEDKKWIKYIYLDARTSVGSKRAVGVAAADGEVIVHVDDDDVMTTTRVATQVHTHTHTHARTTASGSTIAARFLAGEAIDD